MKNIKKSIVSIVKVENEDVAGAFASLIENLGGMNSIVLPYQNVLIKPNWVNDYDYTTGAVTNPELIKLCVKQVLKAGAKSVTVADGSFVGKDTMAAIEKSGLLSIASKRVEIMDLKKDVYETVLISSAKKYRRLKISKRVMEADCIINMPVMKTHDCLPVTLGLKNMKGVLIDKDKRKFHTWGLEHGIIDLNRAVLADLTIIDGTIGMEGDGPTEGTPKNFNTLIASFDPLAAEIVAIKAMGFDPDTMAYIELAREADFGESSMENIEIVGESLEDVKGKFKPCTPIEGSYAEEKLWVDADAACTGCRFVVNNFLKNDLKLIEGQEARLRFVAGDWCEDSGGDKLTMGIGNCILGYKDKCDGYIPGCPPSNRKLRERVKKLIEMPAKKQ